MLSFCSTYFENHDKKGLSHIYLEILEQMFVIYKKPSRTAQSSELYKCFIGKYSSDTCLYVSNNYSTVQTRKSPKQSETQHPKN